MIEVDGSDGGGQLVRSACTLAALTGTPTRVENVRGDRPEPGLKAQHLTAVETLAAVAGGGLDGAEMSSEELTYTPASAERGDSTPEVGGEHVEAAVGTAGSIMLVFDTVLPLAVDCDAPLSVTVSGGTEVKWSPPLAVYERVKLPLCRQIGLAAAVERDRTGFYPAGGGEATLHLAPSSLLPLRFTDRGDRCGARIYSLSSADLAENGVATRQAETARSQLEAAGVGVIEQRVVTAESKSPGSMLAVELVYDRTRAAFDALGEPGKPAERVAEEAVKGAITFDAGDAAVDRHTADQLLIPLVLAGGRVRIPAVTDHVESSLALLEAFGFDPALDTSGTAPTVAVGEK